ncbi:VOC family protein [Novosphingobium bradum]|uniref:VOC family protein n=1 Tax=Novosphingobium bradum TaxID=1737444 RepID=A0ABV7IJ67_9SPHN
MPSYATVGSNRIEQARAFYDALLATAGYEKAFDHPSGGRIYRGPGGMFGVLRPHDGGEASFGNGQMTGFAMDSRAGVDAFHATALEMGGTCEGAPGLRGGNSTSYFAYVRDLDGNKLCAFCFKPEG